MSYHLNPTVTQHLLQCSQHNFVVDTHSDGARERELQTPCKFVLRGYVKNVLREFHAVAAVDFPLTPWIVYTLDMPGSDNTQLVLNKIEPPVNCTVPKQLLDWLNLAA